MAQYTEALQNSFAAIKAANRVEFASTFTEESLASKGRNDRTAYRYEVGDIFDFTNTNSEEFRSHMGETRIRNNAFRFVVWPNQNGILKRISIGFPVKNVREYEQLEDGKYAQKAEHQGNPEYYNAHVNEPSDMSMIRNAFLGKKFTITEAKQYQTADLALNESSGRYEVIGLTPTTLYSFTVE